MLPPSVPRFWICTPPTSRAASTSIGSRSPTIGATAIMAVYVVERTDHETVVTHRDRAQLVERPDVEEALRGASVPKLSATYTSVAPAIGVRFSWRRIVERFVDSVEAVS